MILVEKKNKPLKHAEMGESKDPLEEFFEHFMEAKDKEGKNKRRR